MSLLCIAAGLFYGLVLYYKNKGNKELPAFITLLLFLTRSVLISLLAFFLLGPLIRNIINEQEKPLVLIAQDNSASLAFSKDSSAIRNEYLPRLKKFAEDLREKYEVRVFNFDETLRQSDSFKLNGKESDYSALFTEIENNYSNRNLGAIILSGDGLFNKGNNPLYSVNRIKSPVYTIALGDTSPVKDALIRKTDHNQVAYLGNKFPVEITVDIRQLKTYSGKLSVSKDGRTLAEQQVICNADKYTATYNFIFDADKPGVQKYTVNLSYADEEQNRQNNTRNFVMDVIDSREKILILYAAPHPDVVALKESIEANHNYEVDAFIAANFTAPLKPYSLVILHQVQVNNSRILNELNTAGMPYFLISSGDNDRLPGINIGGNVNRYNDAETVYNTGFALFTLSNELKNYFSHFPAVKAPLGNYNITNSLTAMLNQRIGVVETENPLFVFNQVNSQKSALFIGDGLWRWKLRDYADHQNHNLFNELINKTVQYLSVKADKSFFRVFSKKIINENEAFEFDAEVYNEAYELITEPEVSLSILNNEGKKFDYTFNKTERAYRLNAGVFAPGEYTYRAQVNINGKIYEQKGSITVKELVAEQINTVADHSLLYQLARKSGGEMLYPGQLHLLQQMLENRKDLKTITYTHKKLSDLIDLKWIFYLLMGLLTIEWFMRKRNGLY